MKKILALFFVLIVTSLSLISCTDKIGNGEASKTASTVSALPQKAVTQMFPDEEGLERTEAPELVEIRLVEAGRNVYSGRCEDGASIYVEYDNSLILSTGSVDGSFIFEVNPSVATSPWDIKIYAKTEDKNLSEPVLETADLGPVQESEFASYVWVGKDFRLFFTATENQFLKTELLSEERIDKLTNRTKGRVKTLENIGAEIIYVLIPNPNSIYPEYMPEGLERPDGITLIDQAEKALTEGGATVINMTDTLIANKNGEFPIYMRTDSHWTEYAAFFAYEKLMTKISEKFPNSAPRPVEDFGFAMEEKSVGDLYFDLGMDLTNFNENTVFSNIKFETPYDGKKYKDGEIRIDEATMSEISLSNSKMSGGPDVYIMRDSYSVMMIDFITERCGRTYYKPLWEFKFDEDEISSFSPDYVIYIVTEMNIPNIAR